MSQTPQTEQTDEQQIRNVVASWIEASKAGDLDTVLNLMTDDVVFLTPGNPPMRREDFAARTRAMEGKVNMDGRFDVQEITVLGDTAILWNYLEIAVTPAAGGATVRRAGNVLSVLRRGSDGQWRIWRDGNLLTAAS